MLTNFIRKTFYHLTHNEKYELPASSKINRHNPQPIRIELIDKNDVMYRNKARFIILQIGMFS